MPMVWLILAMVVCLALAAAVVGIVAVPARRDGRQMLTPKGEEVVSGVARRTDKVVSTAKGATGSVASVARSRGGSVSGRRSAQAEAGREAS
ncbi:hypothetical protein FB554_1895 [Barrientosiimonas humi]|uniref:Uncharacterized protein n=2 Tax=Barrientosiimonas TaxID=1535207 RepID=A0A542XD59_9MICO|nr:hypothetical protein FB554_1895 [Barrientosiimonas humi]CAG7573731.1 hypothetical protein BH39T_PBIAJDOK_02369 [Barrientosiimonas humi]